MFPECKHSVVATIRATQKRIPEAYRIMNLDLKPPILTESVKPRYLFFFNEIFQTDHAMLCSGAFLLFRRALTSRVNSSPGAIPHRCCPANLEVLGDLGSSPGGGYFSFLDYFFLYEGCGVRNDLKVSTTAIIVSTCVMARRPISA